MKRIVLFVGLAVSLVMVGAMRSEGQECAPPPFVYSSPPPNVLLAFDNSGSMYDLAYDSRTFGGTTNEFCFDDSYNDSNNYYGYYERNKSYKYQKADNTHGKFVEDSTVPGGWSGCYNPTGTQYFCVTSSTKTVYMKGNFLNWLTMSKLDLIKKSLTGGKYASADQTLTGESRGCVGRSFVKQIPGSHIAFGVIGSTRFGGLDEIYLGGTTQVQVYLSNSDFDYSPCQEALTLLQEGSLGQFKQATLDCLKISNANANSPTGHSRAAFNESLQTCWTYPPIGQGDISRIKNACESVYGDITSGGVVQWDRIDSNDPHYVCAKEPDASDATYRFRYIGACYDEAAHKFQNDSATDACIVAQFTKFCGVFKTPEVIDPSNEFQSTGTYGNVPAVLISTALQTQMGDPLPTLLQNIKAEPTAPRGVLQNVKARVRLGLMGMNNYGSKCELNPSDATRYFYHGADLDGGAVLSDIQTDNPDIVEKFNALSAYPWTPIGEMLYEATRYFRGLDSAYDGSKSYTNPTQFSCQKNTVILLSDGGSTFDENVPGSPFSSPAGVATVDDPGGFNIYGIAPGSSPATPWLTTEEKNATLPYNGTAFAKGVSFWAHTSDMDLAHTGKQSIDFYSVFALGSSTGDQLLQDIAKFGGFVEQDGMFGPTRNDEWTSDSINRVPRNYIAVNQPELLSDKLQALFDQIEGKTGSAGAVATVTQQVEGEDIVVRGAFKTYEPGDPDTLLWKGHLEAYWPYQGCVAAGSKDECEANSECAWETNQCKGLYSFEKADNAGKFCSEITDPNKRCWDANEHMPDSSHRTLFTIVNGVQKELAASDSTFCPAGPSSDPYDLLGLYAEETSGGYFKTSDCANLIAWIKGDSWDRGRDRDGWLLGDIAYSTPIVVGQPSLSSAAKPVAVDRCDCDCDTDPTCAKQCFYCYYETYKKRNPYKMIYVGGNDGMLHAFVGSVWWADPDPDVDHDGDGNPDESHWLNDPAEDVTACDGYACTFKDLSDGSRTGPGAGDIGKELWAYIPSNLLSELKELARPEYGTPAGCRHRTMVDLSPRVFDVYIDPDGPTGTGLNRQWRTVLLGGERGGGDVYFALDVTDPLHPKVLWEYSVLRNMVQLQPTTTTNEYQAVAPYRPWAKYKAVKNEPASFSSPDAGRLKVDSFTFRVADPVAPLDLAPDPKVSTLYGSSLSGYFAFLTGAVRVFGADIASTDSLNDATLMPYMMAVDIEKGVNAFQYLWPMLQAAAANNGQWAGVPRNPTDPGGNRVPYALSSPLALDVWDNTGYARRDGYIDHIYAGDLNGQFYSMKFNLFSTDATTAKGVHIDVTPTKPIPEDLVGSNRYRSDRQPIASMPIAAYDRDYNLHVFFGTGKFDDVGLGFDDRTDQAAMSFYSMQDSGGLPSISASDCISADEVNDTFTITCPGTPTGLRFGGFGMDLDFHCSTTTYNASGCTWVKPDRSPDCCQTDCTDSCWYSVFDFAQPGERMIDSPLVAGNLVFLTTFIPAPEPCGSEIGDANLYIIQYLGKNMAGWDPLQYSTFVKKNPTDTLEAGQYKAMKFGDAANSVTGFQVNLGKGMPSRPVMDSSGSYVLVQTSDSTIRKMRINLPKKPFYFKGWREETSE